MGNSLCKSDIPEEFLRPAGLYSPHAHVDLKRLRKLILKRKLAPCYKGEVRRKRDLPIDISPITLRAAPIPLEAPSPPGKRAVPQGWSPPRSPPPAGAHATPSRATGT